MARDIHGRFGTINGHKPNVAIEITVILREGHPLGIWTPLKFKFHVPAFAQSHTFIGRQIQHHQVIALSICQ